MRGTKKDSHTPTTHLDLWASRLPRGAPVVMKLDIEGCEHGALRGARRHMLPRVRALFTEISPRAMAALAATRRAEAVGHEPRGERDEQRAEQRGRILHGDR